MSNYKLVPVEPTPEMVEAGEYAQYTGCYVSGIYADMLAAAPAVQGEVGEGVPDYINDAIENLEHCNYEMSYSGYQERTRDVELIRAYVARTGQPAEQQPDVTQLVAFCEDAALSIAERTFSTEVDEQLASDIIQYAQRLHSLYTAHRKQGVNHDNQ